MRGKIKFMENKKAFRTEINVTGVIDMNSLDKFIEETDKIIDAYSDYKNNTSMLRKGYYGEFPRIKLNIASYGGCTDCLTGYLDRIDYLRELNIHVDTHASFAYSAGFILYVYGEKRTASPLVKFMNHQSSVSMGNSFIDKMKTDMDFYAECDKQFDRILLERTNMGEERVNSVHEKNKNDWIFYDEGVELGIINTYPGCESEVKEFAKQLSDAFDASVDVFSELSGLSEEDSIDVMYDFLSEIKDQPLDDDDDDYESPEFLDCFEISEETCQDCPDKKECFDVKLESMKCCIESGKCDTCDGKEECLEDRRIMLSIVCDDNTCESCDYVDLCDTVEFDTVKDKDKSECQAPHCSGDCCNCNLCDIEVEEDIETEEDECDCDGSCDNCTCDKDNIPEILELDNVPNCYGEVSPHAEECLSCSFLNACCVKTKAELESCKEITKQEEGIECGKCEFKEECKEQLEFCDKVLNITNN